MEGITNPNFKAIIVGGSVAGLALAHSFDSAGINYVVLEACDTIVPALGATIVVQANRARILDQLGIYERISEKATMVKMTANTMRRSDGSVVNVNDWPRITEQRLGYATGIFERQKFLQALYDELHHKEKVHLNKRVTSILDRGDSVLVQCSDGSSYCGSIVVGADGIRSKVRQEMQRLAPSELLVNDKKSITAEYACFFGVSAPIPSLQDGDLHTVFDIDVSALLFVGHGGLPQWFFITKLDREHYSHEIPRYNKTDMEAKILEHGRFQFSEGITMKDLISTTTSMSYLALEEATHGVWTWGRIVCLGDSIHKMTPNLGQGGNQALEGAAVLTNCLLKTLKEARGETLGTQMIEQTLLKYQNARTERAKQFVRYSGRVTREEALATLKNTLRFLYMPFPSSGKVADIQIGRYAGAPKLDHLPLPARLEQYTAWSIESQIPKPRKSPRAQL